MKQANIQTYTEYSLPALLPISQSFRKESTCSTNNSACASDPHKNPIHSPKTLQTTRWSTHSSAYTVVPVSPAHLETFETSCTLSRWVIAHCTDHDQAPPFRNITCRYHTAQYEKSKCKCKQGKGWRGGQRIFNTTFLELLKLSVKSTAALANKNRREDYLHTSTELSEKVASEN